MASLFKRSNSAVWWCKFYIKDPTTGELKSVRKSTGQRAKKDALPIALELERSAKGAITAGSDQSRKAKAILADAIADLETEKFTALSARKTLSRLLEIATGEELVSYTIQTWCAEWLQRKARGKADATMARYRKSVDEFCEWLGDRRSKPLESITPADARKWVEGLEDSGRSGKTCENYLKDIRAIYKAAIGEGLIASNPFSAVQVSTEGSMSRKPFALDEVSRLLNASPSAEWRGLILVGCFTGLRLGDAAKIPWSAVDLEKKQITLTPAKTRKRGVVVRIPIQPDLLGYLQSIERSESLSVFPTLAAKPLNTGTGLSASFVAIMSSAGVDRGKASRSADDGKKGKGRTTYELGFHSLRHTFTSWLRGAGVSEEDRMALTGHSTRDSHAIYSHVQQQALSDAISKLPTLT